MFKLKNYFKFLISSLLLLCLVVLPVEGSTNYPTPTNSKYINDYTNTLSNTEKSNIISIGSELENKTTAQAVVVVIDTLDNVPIETYANGLFRSWGIGNKDKDNGLLILVALNDKKWRVEVGRGLEGAVPDIVTNDVMTSVALPYFQNNNYGEGIVNSYSTLCDYIAKEYNITLDKSLNITPQTSQNTQTNNRGIGIAGIVIVILVFLDIIFNRGRIIRFLFQAFIFNSFFRGGGPHGGGGFGGGSSGGNGFGGGSSNGGGSSGSW